MGIFSSIKSTFKKSEAAALTQKLLEQQVRNGLLDLDPATLSNKLVEQIWITKPDIFNGKFGQRPHKISVAASALAKGTEFLDEDDTNRNAIMLALGMLIQECEVNGRLYPLNSLDFALLEQASNTFSEYTSILPKIDLFEPEEAEYVYETWDEWFHAFKVEAAKCNPQLKINDNGSSLIDFMDNEPLERGFKAGADPKELGQRFASQFDILSFGQ